MMLKIYYDCCYAISEGDNCDLYEASLYDMQTGDTNRPTKMLLSECGSTLKEASDKLFDAMRKLINEMSKVDFETRTLRESCDKNTPIKLDVALPHEQESSVILGQQVTIRHLEQKIQRQKHEIKYLQLSAITRNRELDALHKVWCDGGCKTGMHRWTGESVTQEIVDTAVANTDRMVRWWKSHKNRLEQENAERIKKEAVPENLVDKKPSIYIMLLSTLKKGLAYVTRKKQ